MEQETAAARPNYGLHVGLFLATCVTTFLSGAMFAGAETLQYADGFAFSGTLMCILVCHEMGHYVVARRHGIDASLPYFIPLPPSFSLGTLGAVIRMRETISDRNKLIDVGAAGPLAGLVVAIPLMVVGLSLSEVRVPEGGIVEGNSLLYLALKYLVHGKILPAADGTDVLLHPMAWASWVGFLLTMINMLPIGQLDGGHIACGYLAERHERFSARLHLFLPVVGVAVTALLAVTGRLDGLPLDEAVVRGFMSAMPWFVWAVLLLVLKRFSGGIYHPPVGDTPLLDSRRRLVLFMAVVFALIFTPVPLKTL